MTDVDVDVVVIGAGFSGLACAAALTKARATVKVLEARDRVGGRTCNDYVTYKDGNVERRVRVDVGGAYVGPTQDRLLRMARDVGVETYVVHSDGNMAMKLKNGHTLAQTEAEPPGLLSKFDVNNVFITIDDLADSLDAEKPWEHPLAEAYDRMTVEEWLQKTLWTSECYEFIANAVRALFCKEPSEISFLYFLFYVKSGQGLLRLLENDNAAQERKFKQGSCTICERLAERLGKDVVQLESAVCAVVSHADKDFVEIRTRGGVCHTARYVVVTVAPPLYQSLGFAPALPAMKLQLAARCPMGSIIKTNMYYSRTYWREKGFSGIVMCTDGPVCVSYDDSGPDSEHPSIMGFVLASHFHDWASKTPDERKHAIARQYAEMFGCDELLEPLAYIEKDWTAEEFSQGCYVGAMPPEVLSKLGEALRQPVGRLHFGGTETATKWSGYMDGAIQAGERCAREVLRKLAASNTNLECDTLPAVEEPPDANLIPRSFDDRVYRWLPHPRTIVQAGALATAAIALPIARRFRSKL